MLQPWFQQLLEVRDHQLATAGIKYKDEIKFQLIDKIRLLLGVSQWVTLQVKERKRPIRSFGPDHFKFGELYQEMAETAPPSQSASAFHITAVAALQLMRTFPTYHPCARFRVGPALY